MDLPFTCYQTLSKLYCLKKALVIFNWDNVVFNLGHNDKCYIRQGCSLWHIVYGIVSINIFVLCCTEFNETVPNKCFPINSAISLIP